MTTLAHLLREKDRRLAEALMGLVSTHAGSIDHYLQQELISEIETFRAEWIKSYPQLETLAMSADKPAQPVIRTKYLGRAKAIFDFIAAPFREDQSDLIVENSLRSALDQFDKKLHKHLVQYAVGKGFVPSAYQGYVGSLLWDSIIRSREVWIGTTLPNLIGDQVARQILRQPLPIASPAASHHP